MADCDLDGLTEWVSYQNWKLEDWTTLGMSAAKLNCWSPAEGAMFLSSSSSEPKYCSMMSNAFW